MHRIGWRLFAVGDFAPKHYIQLHQLATTKMASNELALVNKVDLRLALAESDSQLEQALGQFLPPLLLKLSSPNAEVRQAVFRTVQNVFPRITAARSLQLPVEALLKQAKNPLEVAGGDLGSVRLYSLLFLSKGVERLGSDAQRALIPEVVRGISEDPAVVSARLFSILVKLLQTWKVPERGSTLEEEMRQTLGFDVHPENEKYLAGKFAKFFFLRPNATATPLAGPGLSIEDAAFFTKDAGISYKTQLEILETKTRLLDFMRAGFLDENLVLPILIASADSLSSISDRAESWFRKLTINYEETTLVSTLASLFVGDGRTPAVSSMLQERILTILSKSTLALSHPLVKEISEIGLQSEYAKLRQTTVAFVRKVTKSSLASSELQASYNVDIAARIKDSLFSEGWPQLDTSRVTNYRTAISLRQLLYEALGDVLKNSPALWKNDLTYIRFLFDSLEGESAELRPVLQAVLSSLTVHLPDISQECKEELKIRLKGYFALKYNTLNFASCRYLAIKFVNCTFPFEDSEARLICILGTAKENSSETIEEAQKGLHPYYFNLLQASNSTSFASSEEFLGKCSSVSFPSFSDVVTTLKAEIDAADSTLPIFRCLGEAVRFVLRVLVMQAIEGKSTVVVKDADWVTRLEKALEVDETVRSLVIEEIKIQSHEDTPMDGVELPTTPFQDFLFLTFDAFYNQHTGSLPIAPDIAFGNVFALMISMSPPLVIAKLVTVIPRLLQLINDVSSAQAETKQICQCLGIIGTSTAVGASEVNRMLAQFVNNDAPAGLKEAYLLAGSYLISRMVLRSRVEDLEAQALENYLSFLALSLKEPRLLDACLEGVSQLAQFGALGPMLSLSDNSQANVSTIRLFIEPKAKSCHEKSIFALCKLSLASPSTYNSTSDELNAVEQLVYDTHVSKQIDFTFASGEAFAILAGGWEAKNLRQAVDIQEQRVAFVPPNTGRLPVILPQVLRACLQTKPSLRKAACIWLLSLVQYLNDSPFIRERAVEIHRTFMRFLADRDELVQESASRGLSIVYEMGDNDLKESLVKSLVKSFTDSNAATGLAAGTVDLDTELFDKDVLRTHDSSVSTYKDVLSLAADVGDPSLVYKFMSLAKSNSLWSSRRGMAFGLGSILSKSSLDDLLVKNRKMSTRLIPRLFRYKFDPNQAVALSMNDIWTALISDSSKTINEFFDEILQEVLKSMGSKEWRTRQGSAAALNNLLQTQPLGKYAPDLEKIWNMSFRAMDDIKESVRKEGTQLSKTLAKTLIRAADPSTGNVTTAKAAQMLDYLIPFFLGNKGLLSDAEDVRNFALETVLKLCKIGGKAVKPHVPRLLETFIELMSTLEPEIINYLVLNADKYNLKSSDVDAKRLQNLGHSPMMEAIDQILDMLDDDLMPNVIRLLGSSIKKSVGLPSKVTGSKIIVTLVSKHYALSKPYGDKLLAICIGQLSDRNATVSSSFAVAAGYCCKVASIDKVIDYSKLIDQLYLESQDSSSRHLAALSSEAVSKYSGSDRFEAVAAAFLPMAFIGKHDGEKDVSAVFEREWIENSSGSNAVKLYFDEICLLSEKHVKSNNYTVRQIVARSITDMCSSIDVGSGKDVSKLFTILLETSQGKSWSGKELVFEALVSFSVKKHDFLEQHQDVLNQVVKTVHVEGKRRNKHYQLQAILSVGKFIHSFPLYDELVESYIDIMKEVMDDDYFEDIDLIEPNVVKEGVPSANVQQAIATEELYLKYIRNAVEAVSMKDINDDLLNFALSTMVEFKESGHELTWRTSLSYCENFKLLLENTSSTERLTDVQLRSFAQHYRVMMDFGDQYKLERNIIAFSRTSKLLLDVFKGHDKTEVVNFVAQRINELREAEKSLIVLHELELALS